MLQKEITFFGRKRVLACDGNCAKAWGLQNRPRVGDREIFLADPELKKAPADPGTYEGDCAKPRKKEDLLNKWCARECERSGMFDPGEEIKLRDFTKRIEI